MYAILRADLQMTSGKASSQAGHAFLDSYVVAPLENQLAYAEDGGTKIVLQVQNERELSDLFFRAKKAKLPCAMVIEQDHVMPPHFDGSPVPTAIGIGPLPRSQAKQITRGLPLLR
jgi:peptidyl-tRNA hydrolase